MLRVFKALLEWSIPIRPTKPWLCCPEDVVLLSRTSDAKPLGMSCWVPIFMAAGLLVLRTIEGVGETVGEREGDGEVGEREEEDEEACLASCGGEASEHDEGLRCACPPSAGEGERGVGGSEEFREMREGMLEVEL